MDESQLRTIEQIEQFLAASAEVTFTAHGDDLERYAHISRVLKPRLSISPKTAIVSQSGASRIHPDF